MDDETSVWARALRGEGEAFALLFRAHRGRVYRRALSVVADVHGAEDVTSAAFFELWRKRRVVRLVDGSVLPWLLVTAMNLARNHLRGAMRHRRFVASLPRGEARDAEAEAIARLETQVLGVRLADALATVSRADAALLVLTAVDDLTIAEAAASLGIRDGTARMRLRRARQRLRVEPDADRLSSFRSLSEGGSA